MWCKPTERYLWVEKHPHKGEFLQHGAETSASSVADVFLSLSSSVIRLVIAVNNEHKFEETFYPISNRVELTSWSAADAQSANFLLELYFIC